MRQDREEIDREDGLDGEVAVEEISELVGEEREVEAWDRAKRKLFIAFALYNGQECSRFW